MINRSKINDLRFWKKWQESGAVEGEGKNPLSSINGALMYFLSPGSSLGWQRSYEINGITVLIDLSHKIPRIYRGITDSSDDLDFYTAMANICEETRLANPTRVLYQTRREGSRQFLRIFHNGKRIPEDSLYQLNEKLQTITEGSNYIRSGNLIAAQKLKKYPAKVTLENLSEGEYTVCTTVEFSI